MLDEGKLRAVLVAGAGVVLVAVALACGSQREPSQESSRGSLEATMQAGLDALYTRHDAREAIRNFRSVLARMPSHYGANYQLAAALDAAGHREEALAQWAHVIQLADASHDPVTAEAARKAHGEDEMAILMQEGLDALYVRMEPLAAAERFRKVLALLPSHYGATYQLAAALDAAGRAQEARRLWEKVQAMAEAIGDRDTAETARTRLKTRS